MRSAGAPLGVRCLYGGRHRQHGCRATKQIHFRTGLLAVFPLALLLLTGLYLFVPPYAAKWRSGRRIRSGAAPLD